MDYIIIKNYKQTLFKNLKINSKEILLKNVIYSQDQILITFKTSDYIPNNFDMIIRIQINTIIKWRI